MKLFFARGYDVDAGGEYRAVIVAESSDEAKRALADYQKDNYENVSFEIDSHPYEITLTPSVIEVTETGV